MPSIITNDPLTPLLNVDDKLRAIFDLKYQEKDYWTFKNSIRRHAHVYYHYPAMMVPDMQGELLDILLSLQKGIRSVLDPFVGSSTTMTECMFRGLDFVGQDINPLAILIGKAKIGPFNSTILSHSFKQIYRSATNDQSEVIEINFAGITKWFRSDVAIELSKIFRAIRKENRLWVRRFFWVVFSEVIRLTCNSRTSTYKLHVRPKNDVQNRIIKPLQIFESIAKRNIGQLEEQALELNELDLLQKYQYKFNARIHLNNSSQQIKLYGNKHLYDLVVTSPPYGDNKTTVPYGQNAFLPLQWIPLEDIDRNIDTSYLRSTLEIDSRSLGGILKNKSKNPENLYISSPTLAETMQLLTNSSRNNKTKVLGFFYDLSNSIQCICNSLNKNAYIIWTIANRRVNSKEIPSDQITKELMKSFGAEFVLEVTRDIYSKKMPSRNSITQTMKNEKVLIFRKE